MNKPNFMIFFIGVLYAFETRCHFGGNVMPSNDAELIADGIVFVILALAHIVPSQVKK
jgi:hypothetical protein